MNNDPTPPRPLVVTEAVLELGSRYDRAINAVSELANDPNVDWAAAVADILTAAAANAGTLDAALDRRNGSWEAGLVRQLVEGTAGEDPAELLRHRTAPVTVLLDAWSLLDHCCWIAGPGPMVLLKQYDDARAQIELERTRVAVDSPDWDALFDLEDCIGDVEDQDEQAFGEAAAARIRAALTRALPFDVPLTVDVVQGRALHTPEALRARIGDYLADEALAAAEETPLPARDVLAAARVILRGRRA